MLIFAPIVVKMEVDLNDHVAHLKGVFSEATEFFDRLESEVDWKTIQWRVRALPRLCCHSMQQFPVGQAVANWVSVFCAQNLGVQVHIKDIFGNYYRNGDDYLPHHRDNYSTNGEAVHVISLSFGASRRFTFKKGGKVVESMPLDAGDMVIFDPYMNENYTHGIAKTPSLKEGRINLTCFVTFDGNPYGKKIKGTILSPSEIAALTLVDQ